MSFSTQKTIRVLFVEDNPGDVRLMRLFLLGAEGIGPIELVHVDCLAAAIAQLRGGTHFDVVLLDLSLPDSTGVATLTRLQEASPHTAVVVCTGFDDPEFAIDAVHCGAQDYLVKGQGDGLLVYRSLRYAIERKRLERELVEAKRIAEDANRRKSRFLASMSHELRTPLNAILGFSEMIKEEMLGPIGVEKYIDYATDIFDAGTHLLGLINDVLDLSKVEAGRFQLLEEEVDLAELLAACLEMVSETAHLNHLTLIAPPSRGLPHLRGDARVIRQVLLNLLSNALKFTPPGGVITVHCASSIDGSYIVSVADTGCGIAPDALDKVMDEFQQADLTVARDHGGTGLGLPLSRRFMLLHGGNLSLSSQLGSGTTVTAHFPADRVSMPARVPA
ncbi:MAG TPA: hybrid sensor histidine kinase/response regulator [Patescibacteria group bacterium]|nr:hybrid sensor histidine kinase/response regulator [Patescibacteria group bacterium]